MATTSVISSIDFTDPYLQMGIMFAFLNPFMWNFGGRIEYHTRCLTKLAGGNSRLACYVFGAFIFVLGIVRDVVFEMAVQRQKASPILTGIPLLAPISLLCLVSGAVLVASSMYKLGVIGTYLGDHFGILMSAKITSFPFDVAEHPMYYGSTLCFLGQSLRMRSAAGLVITAFVAFTYAIAARFEGAFTSMIYSKAAATTKKRR